VILDEASQSDILALTALLRGKEVLVVGDGKQVSPTSAFIKEEAIKELKMTLVKKHPYPDQVLPGMSIFDLSQTCFGGARVYLSEHFRCVPTCIAFSNERFYNHKLLPRRLPPRSQRLEPPLLDVFVRNGKKDKKVNQPEAHALVAWLKDNLRSDPSLRDASVGIISLGGAEQARVLCKLVLDQFTDIEIARHKIVTGDPSLWQGDERDLILLSLVASPGERFTVKGKEAEQKFNVALSRARDRMVLFRSVAPRDMANADDLRVWTMQFFQREGKAEPPARASAGPARSSASRSATLTSQLCDWLAQRGFRFSLDCAVGGAVAIVEDATDDNRLCVCLDGGAGATLTGWVEERRAQIALEREGWRFHRIWRASWLVDRERCEAELAAALAEASVRPAADGAGSSGGADAAAASLSVTASPAAAAPAAKRKATPDEAAAPAKAPKKGKAAAAAAAATTEADDEAEVGEVMSSKKQGKQPADRAQPAPKPPKEPKEPKPPKEPKEPKPPKEPKEKEETDAKQPPAKASPKEKKEPAAKPPPKEKKEPPKAKKEPPPPKKKKKKGDDSDSDWEP